jgi:hypothetical protein
VEVCSHSNPNCHPVNPGDLFAAISFFTFWPWMIVFLGAIYFALDENDISLGSCFSRVCSRTPSPPRPPESTPSRETPPPPASEPEPASRLRRASDPLASRSAIEMAPVPAASTSGSSAPPRDAKAPAVISSFTAEGSAAKPATSGSTFSLSSAVRILSGSLVASEGMTFSSHSKCASFCLRQPLKHGVKWYFEVTFTEEPSGPLVVGVVRVPRPLNERSGETVGQIRGSFGVDLSKGLVLAESADSGPPPYEQWRPGTIKPGDVIGVTIDRISNSLEISHNGRTAEPFGTVLADVGMGTGDVMMALSISGGDSVSLALDNGWGALKHKPADVTAVGHRLEEGNKH